MSTHQNSPPSTPVRTMSMNDPVEAVAQEISERVIGTSYLDEDPIVAGAAVSWRFNYIELRLLIIVTQLAHAVQRYIYDGQTHVEEYRLRIFTNMLRDICRVNNLPIEMLNPQMATASSEPVPADSPSRPSKRTMTTGRYIIRYV